MESSFWLCAWPNHIGYKFKFIFFSEKMVSFCHCAGGNGRSLACLIAVNTVISFDLQKRNANLKTDKINRHPDIPALSVCLSILVSVSGIWLR